ncbi:MAG: S9 family peptidase [Chitinophagaceae bacterium]|nr:S9 family peptidase [Chitinophagaceae bacterium]
MAGKYFLLLMMLTSFTSYAQFGEAIPPVADKKPYWRDIHGDKVLDNYYWMYDYFGKGPDSTKVLEYLTKENEYFDAVMKPNEEFRKRLFEELKARVKEDDQSVPVLSNGYFYYTRSEKGKQYYKYCRRKGSMKAPEEILLDVDAMAAGHPYFSVIGMAVSENGRYLAYGADAVSRRQYVIFIKDLKTGKTLSDRIENTEGDPVWANDNKTIFYSSKNPVTLLSEKIMRHQMGDDARSDALVYEEKDKSNYIGVGKSKNKKYIFIISEATLSSEWRMTDADKPHEDFVVFQPRMKDVLYSVYPVDGKFYVLTNRDGAKNFKLMECPVNATSGMNWKEVIPENSEVLLEDVSEFKNFLAIQERKNGLTQIRIRNLKTGEDHYVDFGDPDYVAGIMGGHEYDKNEVRYTFSSLVTPASTFDYDMAGRSRKLMKQLEIGGGFDKDNYQNERLYATAEDGTKVPISIVYRKGNNLNQNTPLLLYGYGSYGASMDPYFNRNVISLLDRGFVYAIAHIRGGQEMGRQWYLDGKLMKKKNTFTDFIDCAKFLVDKKYTSPSHLYANGGSAGGLLMGAVVNMAPQLWHGVIAQVPFVDVVNTMLDENIPLTTNEFDEWGNPKNKEAYFYMKSYSPYENVERKNYPNLLVTTGLHDSQVQYFEPAKWVARLRDRKTDNNILLLKTEMNFGHGGASGRFDYLKDVAVNYAFLLTLEGQKN